MQNVQYPSAPIAADNRQQDVSPEFRRQVGKVITSITLFALVYILLVIAAVILAIGCCYLGVMLIVAIPKFLTLLIGLGLMGVGISVLVFLVKFIFAVSKDENPNRVEITEQQQPRLFAFIRQLTEETNTPFPRRIFLSPDVNACVFYNSSFWSMFLPVRKNLEIGLGLVNCINISEFKAVMAHEFGHFSQRSMKLGSFTYNVNRVIHNMLYDNNSYTSFLQAWGNIHGYLSIFAALTVKIATGIQWILKEMYKFINRNYMGLSREMEFHADAVAAGVSGGNNVISALSRIELAGSCYQAALNKAGERLKENQVSSNIFSNQLTVFRQMAVEHRLPVRGGLPEISFQFMQSFSRSRINYKNQWASHPTLQERKASVDRLNLTTPPDETSTWVLFDHTEELQEEMTKGLYRSVTIQDNASYYDGAQFAEWYKDKRKELALPQAYKGYYDGRYVDITDWDLEATALSSSGIDNTPSSGATVSSSSGTVDGPSSGTVNALSSGGAATFDQLFNEETAQISSSIGHNSNDIELVRAIQNKQVEVSSFDFDGQKYSRKDCENIIKILEKDNEELTARQQALDKAAFHFFLSTSPDTTPIRSAYQAYGASSRQYNTVITLINQILKAINPFYTGGVTLEQVKAILSQLKGDMEPALKNVYRQLLSDGYITREGQEEVYDLMQEYLQADYAYFIDNQFENAELNKLAGLAIKVEEVLNRQKFAAYKHMLEVQLG